MHSWRVLILPCLQELALYDQYDFNEPWDGPNNHKLAGQIPSMYRCPSSNSPVGASLATKYLAIVGSKTIWPGVE